VKIRRVVVGLEPAPFSRPLLEAAAELAQRMQAELVGLFVESQDLLHFAGLPFAREVGFASATRRRLDVESMERALRALAGEARRTLAAIAERTPVQWSFRVSRGSLPVELLAAAGEADLVIASLERPGALPESLRVRVVRADDPKAVRAALAEEDGGILLVTGSDGERIRELLKWLTAREDE
jgi:hypothetical protein